MAKGFVKAMIGLIAAVMVSGSAKDRKMARDMQNDVNQNLNPSFRVGFWGPYPSRIKNQRQKRRDARRANRKVK